MCMYICISLCLRMRTLCVGVGMYRQYGSVYICLFDTQGVNNKTGHPASLGARLKETQIFESGAFIERV